MYEWEKVMKLTYTIHWKKEKSTHGLTIKKIKQKKCISLEKYRCLLKQYFLPFREKYITL